jgi:hypothetical protein
MPSPVEPARPLPGVTQESLERLAPRAEGPSARAGDVVRGKALIFWDPKRPGQKLDADRHRPDHARGGLRLREPRDARRALEGGLVPPPDAGLPRACPCRRDVRHRGAALRHRQLARDVARGLKGVAEEAGLEMVIVAGENMGDIFRRNALNLGLHVVQSPRPSPTRRTATASRSTRRRGR